jgi:S1-C subfamily serine protease
MFTNAIKEITKFTRPILFVQRLNSDKLIPGSATLFFINEDGYALTCKHVVTSIINVANNSNKAIFKFDGCYQKIEDIKIIMHPKYDLAIIKFNGINPLYSSYAYLKKDNEINPGKFLVRSGFAFPEFDNYKIDIHSNKLIFTNGGNQNTPLFSNEGMISRLVADQNGIRGIELTTPGIKGTSGGPLYDENGIIYGIQSLSKHYHLGFDIINENVLINGEYKEVSNYPFISLGECVSINVIKDFLKENNIKYYEK